MPTENRKPYRFDRCPYGQEGCAPKSCPECLREWQGYALRIKSPEGAQALIEHDRRNEESVELARLFMDLCRRLRPEHQQRANDSLRRLLEWGTKRLPPARS